MAYIGRWPCKDHRGNDLDDVRKRRAGASMSDRWAVVEYRGDWILENLVLVIDAGYPQKM